MRTYALLCFLIGTLAEMAAQNLVVNPGFEQLEKPFTQAQPCRYTKHGSEFTKLVHSWASFADRTPDLIAWDSTLTNCPYPPPKEGNHYAGIITFLPRRDSGHDFDYHEYVQGTLHSTLVAGRTYRLSFWMYQSDSVAHAHIKSIYGYRKIAVFSVSAANLGLCLLKEPVIPTLSFAQNEPYLELKPVYEMKYPPRAGKPGRQRVSAVFTATENARYFIIGNFRDDVHTPIYSKADLSRLPALDTPGKKSVFDNVMRISYVCIDDVSITEEPLGAEIAQALNAGGRYIFKGVYFATGSHELELASFPELEALAAHLLEHPQERAEIAGHTDNAGADEANRLLSERRAQSVFHFLVEQGVPEERLTYKGYGRTKPVASNQTEEGRRQNRRVECVLR